MKQESHAKTPAQVFVNNNFEFSESTQSALLPNKCITIGMRALYEQNTELFGLMLVASKHTVSQYTKAEKPSVNSILHYCHSLLTHSFPDCILFRHDSLHSPACTLLLCVVCAVRAEQWCCGLIKANARTDINYRPTRRLYSAG